MVKRTGRLFEIVEVGAADDFTSRFYDFFGVFCILLHLICNILTTFESVRASYGQVLSLLELLTVVFFAIDYVLRLLTAGHLYPEEKGMRAVSRYVCSFFGIVDLMSFLPYFLPFFIPAGAVAFRMFRLVRIFRLFRVGVYYDSLNVITEVLRAKRSQLMSSVFIILTLMLAASLCMYSLEHEAQPDIFQNAFSGIWWAVSTLLTVGYGDIYPVTSAGKVFSIILTFLGVGLVAIPTGIISAGFVEQYARVQRKADFLKETDINFIKCRLRAQDAWCGKTIAELALPQGTLLAVVRREGETIVPRAQTKLRADDIIVMGAEPFDDTDDVELTEITLSPQNPWVGKKLRELDISRQTLVVVVHRGSKMLVPDGKLTFERGDRVILYSKQDAPTDDANAKKV